MFINIQFNLHGGRDVMLYRIKDIYNDFKKNKLLLLMIMPAVIFYFIFSYLPMSGIVLAFKSFDYNLGIFGSPWVGFDNFKFFFLNGDAFKVTRNTVLYNFAFISVNMFLQITVAIFLSEMSGKYFKKITQSFMLLPYFISWVIVSVFVYNIFNYEFGAINSFLIALGFEPVDISGTIWAWKYILIFFSAWKNVGYGTIIYLAAITGIDKEIYEASEIDGAGLFKQIRHITLPSLRPTIIILLLLSVGYIFRGDFGLFYQIVGSNPMLFDSTDVIDTYVFRSLIASQEFGMASATAFYQSVLCFSIIMIVNYVIRRIDKDTAIF
jgi:putative aldouronate transport system permease protein